MRACCDHRWESGGTDQVSGSSADAFGLDELASLLDEIRSSTPSPAEIVEVVRTAAAGELSPRRLNQIARDIHDLYRKR